MCRIIATVVLSLVALGIISCVHHSTPQSTVPEKKWVDVDGIPPEFADHVRDVLQQAGIPSYFAGSIEWDVIVPAGTEAQAAALLRADADLRGCSGQMYWLLYVADLLSAYNGGHLPSDFLSMTNCLDTPKHLLICPSDHLHRMATNWASFTTNNCSYEIVSPGIYKTDTNVVYLRCKIHGYVGYSDRRVVDNSGRVLLQHR